MWKRLHPYGFDLYESPVNRYDVEGLAEVRRSVSSPISEHIHSEEYAFRLIKEERAVDIFNVSVSVAGGITAARRLLDLADMAGLACLIGTTETSIARPKLMSGPLVPAWTTTAIRSVRCFTSMMWPKKESASSTVKCLFPKAQAWELKWMKPYWKNSESLCPHEVTSTPGFCAAKSRHKEGVHDFEA